jgi:hypothetical protein
MNKRATQDSYNTLLDAYDYFNEHLFAKQLPEVIITFHRQRKVMGYASIGRWVNQEREFVDELAVNPEYFAKYPLMEICQTLCHEMVHIWQAHYGNSGRRGYHNNEWAKKMTRIGLMPSASGKPGGQTVGEWMMDYVLFDGQFHRSCQNLLTQGFILPWVDRYPVHRLDLPLLAYDDKGNPIELDSKLNVKKNSKFIAARTIQTLDSTDPVKSNPLGSVEEETLTSWAGVFEREGNDPEQHLLQEVLNSKPRAKSGRIKYCCKSCHIQVWGKPGLNIDCADCKQRMQGEI